MTPGTPPGTTPAVKPASTPFTSTYRVQLHKGFGLDDARALVGYWAALGIDACYTSPISVAEPGSMHGYDVTDPTRVNPELGGREAFDRLSDALRAAGLALLLDIVPNHQAATTRNPTWYAMLAGGKDSAAARTFDVDWSGNEYVAPGRLCWPVLTDPIEEEIASGHLRLEAAADGSWRVRYFDEVLPVAGPVEPGATINDVLARQHYQLTDWRSGAHARNYRRFFDVSTLAGVRVEDDAVFRATHSLIFELVQSGRVQGLRVDHIDGLADPQRYLERLAAATSGTYTVVEKILAADEMLPDDWVVAGTTGYDVLDELCSVFIDANGRAVLEDRLLGENGNVRFPAVQHAAKWQALAQLFEPEMARLGRALVDTAKAAGIYVAEAPATDALAAATVAERVYRTYLTGGRAEGEDRRRIIEALAGARTEPGGDEEALAAVGAMLLGDDVPTTASDARAFMVRLWQQLSGPVMAKGHEDTACYRYPVLLAQSEVGGDPGDPATDAIARFHRRVGERWSHGRRGLVATSTHDTKRSEDVRARLAVLSERPAAFEAALATWRTEVGAVDGVAAPDTRFLAQTLLGSWPLEAADLATFGDRIAAYLTKALREAKQKTSWLAPDEHYEQAVISVARHSIERDGRVFLAHFGELLQTVAFHGACNSLAQVVARVALPGVVDTYQGTELWDFSLVDPDNRRPVDYEHRRVLLDGLDASADGSRLCASLRRGWRSGAIKLFVLSRALRARRANRALFVDGAYTPLAVSAPAAAHALAFARRLDDQWAIAIVPRRPSSLTVAPAFPIGASVWGETVVSLPPGAPRTWHDAFCGSALDAPAGTLRVADAVAALPAALLVASSPAAAPAAAPAGL